MNGQVYQIEEEIYSDADNSSVYTSEDEFQMDDELQNRFREQNPLGSASGSAKGSLSSPGGLPEHKR